MRQTKFRGKRLDTGEWVYGDYFRKWENGEVAHFIADAAHLSAYFIDPETKGEWVGRKDKVGNDVYEGDVLEYEDFETGPEGDGNLITGYGIVEWDAEHACFNVTKRYEVEMSDFEWENSLILGSIHDPNHEELLK